MEGNGYIAKAASNSCSAEFDDHHEKTECQEDSDYSIESGCLEVLPLKVPGVHRGGKGFENTEDDVEYRDVTGAD